MGSDHSFSVASHSKPIASEETTREKWRGNIASTLELCWESIMKSIIMGGT